MTTPSFNRKFGRTEFPAPFTGETTLASLDPARDILLEVLATALNADLAAPWSDATSGTQLAGTSPVQRRHPQEPSLAYLREVKTDFPALFVYRTGDAELDDIGIWRSRLTQKWGVDYILGPLDAGNSRKLGDILTAAAKLIAQVIQMGGHYAYGIDANGVRPLQVFGSATDGSVAVCGFSSIEAKSPQRGAAKFSEDGPVYHALSLTIVTTEVDDFTDATANTTAAVMDWGYGVETPDEETIEDFVEASSDV